MKKTFNVKELTGNFKEIFNKIFDKRIYISFFARYKKVFISFISLSVLISLFIFQNQNSTSLNGMLRKSKKYLDQGKLSLAIESYTRTAKLYPGNYDVHIRLGDLLLQVKEPEKAKIEYYRAIKLNSISRFDGYFSLASIYANEGDYKFARELLLPLDKVPDKNVLEKLGDFYHGWGLDKSKVSDCDSLRQLQTALDYYKKANSRKTINAKISIDKAYVRIAKNLVKENRVDEAIKILNLSINFNNNPLAYYELGRIYETKNIDLAISEYEKAFKNNKFYPSLSNKRLFDLFIKKANNYKAKGDSTNAEYYYFRAKKLAPDNKIPYITDKSIILNLKAAKYNEDMDKDTVTPGICFSIMNVSQETIDNLKAKVVFYDNEKYLSENVFNIAEPASPMAGDVTSELYVVFSTVPAQNVFATHRIKVEIYLSQHDPDQWKLYRQASFQGTNNNRIRVQE